MRLYIDLESSCVQDLGKVGAYRYFSDPSAKILCAAGAYDSDTVETIMPFNLKAILIVALAEPETKFVFHNALFEMTGIKLQLGIDIPPSRVIDTMAKAGYYGYPRGLDDAAKAIGCSKLKDIQGKAVMKRLCKGEFTPDEKPDDFARLYEYCCVDVEVMREIDKRLPDLPPDVQALWELDAEINMRGVPVDVQAIDNAVYLKDQLAANADRRMAEITGGGVTTVNQTARLETWLQSQQVAIADCQADTVRRALATMPLPSTAREALELRQEAALSSLAKYDAMQRQQVNGRLYHMFDWYGAHTGRPTGYGPQVMNLARSENPEYWAELICSAPQLVLGVCAEPQKRLKDGLRGMICAPENKTFVGLDLSQIEARATAWAAGEQKLLNIFASGRDPYCEYGRDLWGRTITKDDYMERTAAKATVLAMGFAGGIGAFQVAATTYGLNLGTLAGMILPTASPAEMEQAYRSYKYYLDKKPEKPLTETEALAADVVKQRYRRDFANIAGYWDELEWAFINGGEAGPVRVDVGASNLRTLTLPSGRQLFYHAVKQDDEGQLTYQARKFRHKIWKGTLMENVAQAINHDISTWYMMRANKIAPVIHQCYDEFTLEIPQGRVVEVQKRLEELMATKPAWAEGLPLAYELWEGKRYGK